MSKKYASALKKRFALIAAAAPVALSLAAPMAHAELQLESSVVIVNQGDGEGSISLKNESDEPVLLHSELVNVPEDDADLLLITPPITRVDAQDTQMVRFILKDTEVLTTERLKRVTFEGIPQTKPNVVRVSLRQNIPLIIRPAGLEENKTPWKLLKWSKTAAGILVENPSPYVVRMMPSATVKPAGSVLSIPKSYILPGEKLTLETQASDAEVQKVEIQPASVNGYILDSYEAVVEAQVSKPAQ